MSGIDSSSFSPATTTTDGSYGVPYTSRRIGSGNSPYAPSKEPPSETDPRTGGETDIELAAILTNTVRFRSSDGQEIEVIIDLAERNPVVKERLQDDLEGNMGSIPVDFDSTTIHLSIIWHLFTHRNLGLWDDFTFSIPPRNNVWIHRHFIGLDEALMRDLLAAAKYFKLRGLHHTICNELRSRMKLPWVSCDTEFEFSTTEYSNNKTCFQSSDGEDVCVLNNLVKQSSEARAHLLNRFGDQTGPIKNIQVDFSSAAIRLCIKWFFYSQRLQDIWLQGVWDQEPATTIPPGRDEWVRTNFLGLSEDLMRNILRAAQYFRLKGLHRTIGDEMDRRNMPIDNAMTHRPNSRDEFRA